VPWAPELFSAPARARLEQEHRIEELVTVPFFPGLMTGEIDALVGSFAGEPELHHPVQGRVKGKRAFERYVSDTQTWLKERNISIEEIGHTIRTGRRSVGEGILHLDGGAAPVDLPVAIVTDRRPNGRIEEIRMYYSSWPLSGRHANRPPVLQPDPELAEPDVVGEYQRGLAAGNVDAIVAAFEPDGYAREPGGAQYTHRGAERLRAFYEWWFSNNGGIRLGRCTLTDDEHECAVEYNVVRWGKTELGPEAGIAVHERGDSGKLVAARIYDGCDPPLDAPT
jgi:hypothetical protein